VHKLNALDGAAYILENRQPFGVQSGEIPSIRIGRRMSVDSGNWPSVCYWAPGSLITVLCSADLTVAAASGAVQPYVLARGCARGIASHPAARSAPHLGHAGAVSR
jgi:hypothetical protein